MPVSTRAYAIAALTVTAAALAGFYVASIETTADPFVDCRQTAIAGGAGSIGGPFTLTDEDGRTVTDKDVLAKPSLVYFGYTFCPDVCPTDVARNAEAVDALEEMGVEVTPVFISVDPARDTPPVLKTWTDNFHPRLIGLTGTPDQIEAAAKAYRTIYRVPDAPADDNYVIDHMTYTYLMLPNLGFADVFTSEVPADEIAKRVSCYIDASKGV